MRILEITRSPAIYRTSFMIKTQTTEHPEHTLDQTAQAKHGQNYNP